ncbi:hypothetical protein DYY65_04205 [Nitrososphaera sp. AFS]|nr:hypothetical protein [Nitrososphaera sp. AFS]
MRACGLKTLLYRRTFDRRLSTVTADIKERVAAMASLLLIPCYSTQTSQSKQMKPYYTIFNRIFITILGKRAQLS